jgi:hypothetical protein
MELVCPSCATRHRTEEHPNAFEIACVCGYSILVPDEAALARPVDPDGFESVPSAMEEGDAIPFTPAGMDPRSAPEASSMTPPEELPREMAYDPFELQAPPSAEEAPPAPPMPTWDPVAAPEDATFVGGVVPSDPTAAPTGAWAVNENAAPAPRAASAPLGARPSAGPAKADRASGQAMVDRVQAASMGQLLGDDFDLAWGELARGVLVAVTERVTRLVAARPWLENELRARGIDLATLPDRRGLAKVPEIVALEIYLACFELGGQCDVRRSPDRGPTPLEQ